MIFTPTLLARIHHDHIFNHLQHAVSAKRSLVTLNGHELLENVQYVFIFPLLVTLEL
eukprot:UN10167